MLASKYGISIGVTFALIFAVSAFFIFSNKNINELELSAPEVIVFSISFIITIISILIGVVGTIGKKLLLVNDNA